MTTTAHPAWTTTAGPAGCGSPLGDTAARLSRLTGDHPHVYAVDLADTSVAGWTPLSAVVPVLAGQAAVTAPGAAAPVRVAGALAHAVAGRMTAALVVDRRSPVLEPAATVVRPDGAGHLERVAVTSPAIALLAGDPAADHPDALALPDEESLLRWAAGTIVGTLSPLFTELRAVTRFGIVPMWNMVGDSVLSMATWIPFLAGSDQGAGRALGDRLVDALVREGAPVRRRGRTLCLTRTRSTFVASVDAACCMHYRTCPEVPRVDAYCVSCPHLSDEDRRGRYLAYLDEHHPEPAAPEPT